MAHPKAPSDELALDALTLTTEAARAAYQEQRLKRQTGLRIRHERELADLTQTELIAGERID